jgi:hypothetical protein
MASSGFEGSQSPNNPRRNIMRLELPFEPLLPEGTTVLIAGMGGGFDVFCGLPLYFELKRRGYAPHLASLSFAALKEYQDSEWLSPTLVGVGAGIAELSGYHPERFLARWFQESQGEEIVVWCFEAAGTVPLLEDYRRLVQRLRIDAIVIVDGGVDSLTRGDEELCGTILEDYVSLAAVSQLREVPVRVMACIGMGVEGDVSHGRIFENIAALTQQGGLLGVSALLTQSAACQLYEEALAYVHARPGQQPSVINASVISAAQGHFGDYHRTERTRGSKLWISPLMNLYWFFSVDAVAAQNLFLLPLQQANSMGEVFGATYEAREAMELRPIAPIRLP